MNADRLDDKQHRLEAILGDMGSVLVAFSGGVDSTLMTAVARRVLGRDRMAAVTARGPVYPQVETERAAELARLLDVEHMVLDSDATDDERFVANAPDRCYYCKLSLCEKLRRIAEERRLAFVVDGTNADDAHDFRPGTRAADEMGVRHPFLEAGLSKADVRALSARLGLPTADLPSAACLASRLPYGERITPEALRRVERAEAPLRALGLKGFRVRSHGAIARVELASRADEAVLLSPANRDRIIHELKALGFSYVTLDLEGYRTGSMNEVLTAPPEPHAN